MKQCSNFIIVANVLKDKNLANANLLLQMIEVEGKRGTIIAGEDKFSFMKDGKDLLEEADCVIVLGGDGTMLRAAHALDGKDVPIIGVNLGTVGFLTEVAVTEMSSMLSRLISGDYKIEERMMLESKVTLHNTTVEEALKDSEVSELTDIQQVGKDTTLTLHALNDAVLARENTLRIIALKIYLNGELFDTCEADGILIATPTGSTGYNLSAGGPIVIPGTKLMVMTPISPYSLSRRSVVFGADDTVKLELVEKRKNGDNYGIVSLDGYNTIPMKVGDFVEVTASSKTLKLMKLDRAGVYEILRKKIGG